MGAGLLPTRGLRGDFTYYRAAAYADPPHLRADTDQQLSTPVLFLFGTRHVNAAQAMGARPLEEGFPKVKSKHLGNYDHFLQWEAAEDVNRGVFAFLS